jgi:hypothetical protein
MVTITPALVLVEVMVGLGVVTLTAAQGAETIVPWALVVVLDDDVNAVRVDVSVAVMPGAVTVDARLVRAVIFISLVPGNTRVDIAGEKLPSVSPNKKGVIDPLPHPTTSNLLLLLISIAGKA